MNSIFRKLSLAALLTTSYLGAQGQITGSTENKHYIDIYSVTDNSLTIAHFPKPSDKFGRAQYLEFVKKGNSISTTKISMERGEPSISYSISSTNSNINFEELIAKAKEDENGLFYGFYSQNNLVDNILLGQYTTFKNFNKNQINQYNNFKEKFRQDSYKNERATKWYSKWEEITSKEIKKIPKKEKKNKKALEKYNEWSKKVSSK